MEILALIPARSGSKSVIDKNIRDVAGRPMLAWSIEHALNSRLVNRVILSTDSEAYAAIGRQYGAETPFLRPAEYATDTATDLEVFRHALMWLAEHEDYHPDIVVQLRPTYPKRNPADIDAMIRMLIDNPPADSVRSIAPAGEVPYKMWLASSDDPAQTPGRSIGRITPLMTDIPECYNMPRQSLPQAYYQNACIDVMRASTILEKSSMTGGCILGYLMSENLDIDTETELLRAQVQLLKAENEKLQAENMKLQSTADINRQTPQTAQNLQSTADSCQASAQTDSAEQNAQIARALRAGGRRLVFDIDGVIACLEPTNNYALSEPNRPMIEAINRLHDAGNTIVLHTARGFATGMDWSELTRRRLDEWGLKYHELYFGKPNADYYIDDRMLDMDVIMKTLDLT